ncbi:MAG TPA: MauE/DoxX family redox-associated membrane protein [Kofleriaceae bacterium]
MAYLELACRAMLVVVLGAAAAGKLRRRDFEGFLVALRAFGLPAGLAGRPAASLIVALEVTAAVLLVAAPLAGYALAFALIAAFTAALRRVVHSGQRVVCRCFGASTTPVGVSHLVRNAMFLVVIGLGIAAALASGASIAPSTRLVVIACGALAGAGAARWDDLAYLVRPALARRHG